MAKAKKPKFNEKRINNAVNVICEALDGMTLPDAVSALGTSLVYISASASYEVDHDALNDFICDSLDKIKELVKDEIEHQEVINESAYNLN